MTTTNLKITICELVEFKLNMDKATHIVFTEQQCASIYKALIEQNNIRSGYLKKRLNSIENTMLLPYELEYPVGTILESRFDEIKYVYLYTYNKKKFGLKMNSKIIKQSCSNQRQRIRCCRSITI